jgi:DNA-binding NtrC family response regulator
MNQFLKLKNFKTLLVDDNAVVRDTMKMIFTQKECILKAFETAEEGLQALEEEHFDILISDLRLPGIDGVEFFKRAAVAQPDAIKILISGYGNESTVSEAFEIGVHAFIKKPFSLTAFLDQLMPHVEQRCNQMSRPQDEVEQEEEPEDQSQHRTAGNSGKGPQRSRAKHSMSPLSYLPSNPKNEETLSDRGDYPNQAAV